MNIYYVWCEVCDYDNKFLIQANTKKEAIDRVYKHYINTNVAGFRGEDECGYCTIPKDSISAISINKLFQDTDIWGVN